MCCHASRDPGKTNNNTDNLERKKATSWTKAGQTIDKRAPSIPKKNYNETSRQHFRVMYTTLYPTFI